MKKMEFHYASSFAKDIKSSLIFLIPVLIISLCGVINLVSITSGGRFEGIYLKQILWISLGFFTFFLTTLLGERRLKSLIIPLYFFTIFLLIFVLFKGTGSGAKRWLRIGFLNFQPSELAKVSTILLLCSYLEKRWKGKPLTFFEIFPLIFITGIPFFLIFLEPDMGTALLILFFCGFTILFAGIDKKALAIISLTGIVFSPILWKYGLHDYQRKRIQSFIFPEKDPLGSGYQSLQSKITVGSGGLWGKGYKKGTQTRLKFLPEQHTDFAFSVWAEEHGFVGSFFIIFLYIIIILSFVDKASKCREPFPFFLNLSITFYLGLTFFLNLGMVTGIFPVVGIPLIFFGYGGSSYISAMLLLGYGAVFKS